MKCGLIGAAAILVLLAISLEHVHAVTADGCPNGYDFDAPDRLCYKSSSPVGVNYADAVSACAQDEAELPAIPRSNYNGHLYDTWMYTPDPSQGCDVYSFEQVSREDCSMTLTYVCTKILPEEEDELEFSVTGDPLVKTCDGAPIFLVGQGEFTLAEDITPADDVCAFSIRVITAPASDPLFTMLQAVHIVFDTIDIRVDQTGTQVGASSDVLYHITNWANPLYEQPDVYTGEVVTVAGYTVSKDGDDIVFHSDHCNINVRFTHDGDNSEVYVTLGSEYKNRMEGLCGNCNGDYRDDFVTSGGDDVTDDENRNSLISISWLIVYNPTVAPLPPTPPPPPTGGAY